MTSRIIGSNRRDNILCVRGFLNATHLIAAYLKSVTLGAGGFGCSPKVAK